MWAPGRYFSIPTFSRYILADINSDLIGLYNIVKLRTDEYVAAAREMFVPENNVAERYYQYRDEFNQSRDPLRRAVLFLYLNRHGYNGLCRYNLRGEFNVPFGRYKSPISPRQSSIISPRKHKTPSFTANRMKSACNVQIAARWYIAIHPMRR